MNKQVKGENFLSNSSPPLQKLTGWILKKEKKKFYQKKSPFYQNTYLKLQAIDEQKKEHKIFVYPNLVKPKVFNDINNNVRVDNRYFLFCERKGKRWILHNWQELTQPIFKSHA